MSDWKEALDSAEEHARFDIACRGEGRRNTKLRDNLATIRAHIEGLEARVQELEIELDARVNQQVSAGTREKLVSARDKLDGDEWRAICGMFIEADNVARGCQEYAREVEDKLRRFLDITEGYMKSKSGGDEERWYEEFYTLRPG